MHIPYFEIPAVRDSDAASAFDRGVFSSNPNCHHFLRRCLPIELPPSQYRAICGADEQLFKLVVQVFPGFRMAALLTRPRRLSPADCCVMFENDEGIADLIRDLRGGAHGNN